jgi:hypothetical protein
VQTATYFRISPLTSLGPEKELAFSPSTYEELGARLQPGAAEEQGVAAEVSFARRESARAVRPRPDSRTQTILRTGLARSDESQNKYPKSELCNFVSVIVGDSLHEGGDLLCRQRCAPLGRQWRPQSALDIGRRVPETATGRHPVAKYGTRHVENSFRTFDGSALLNCSRGRKEGQRLYLIDEEPTELNQKVLIQPASQAASISLDPPLLVDFEPFVCDEFERCLGRGQAFAWLTALDERRNRGLRAPYSVSVEGRRP